MTVSGDKDTGWQQRQAELLWCVPVCGDIYFVVLPAAVSILVALVLCFKRSTFMDVCSSLFHAAFDYFNELLCNRLVCNSDLK
jgi:hypothetical protein